MPEVTPKGQELNKEGEKSVGEKQANKIKIKSNKNQPTSSSQYSCK